MLATRIVVSRLGPAGLLDVVGRAWSAASDEPSTASRVRLKSRLCLSTAPAATSPIRSPASPNRATSPSRAAVSMSWLEALAYFPLARANGMRFPPRIAARRGPDGPPVALEAVVRGRVARRVVEAGMAAGYQPVTSWL